MADAHGHLAITMLALLPQLDHQNTNHVSTVSTLEYATQASWRLQMGREQRILMVMRFASALTLKRDVTEIVDDLASQVWTQMPDDASISVAFLFTHIGFTPVLNELVPAIRSELEVECLVGCTSAGVIGVDREIEQREAVSLLVASMPEADIQPFRVTETDVEEWADATAWHRNLGFGAEPDRHLVVLADPFTIAAIRLVNELSAAYPGAPLIGGLASGGQNRGEHRLFLNDELLDEGAVGVALSGNVRITSVVSAGCRPIGQPLIVTRAEKNVIFEIGGRPPMQVLHDMLPSLPERDQQLARTALLLGRVINEYQEDFSQGDFLIRNLLGGDEKSGALAVGDFMHTGQTVQFQVRDGQTAHDDLRHLLAGAKQKRTDHPPRGALLFSCLGRGQSMYGAPSHDVRLMQKFFPALPSAGFFCNGEIGPVGGRAYVHGFTTVIGLFSPVRTIS